VPSAYDTPKTKNDKGGSRREELWYLWDGDARKLNSLEMRVMSSAANYDSLPTPGPIVGDSSPHALPPNPSSFTLVATLLIDPFPLTSSSLRSPNLSRRSHADRPSIIGRCHKRARHLENPVVPCRTLCTRPLADGISVRTVSLLGIHFYCEKVRFSYVLLSIFCVTSHAPRSTHSSLSPFYFSPIAIELRRFCLALADHAHAVAHLDTVQ